jgi:hypothetical protein
MLLLIHALSYLTVLMKYVKERDIGMVPSGGIIRLLGNNDIYTSTIDCTDDKYHIYVPIILRHATRAQ